jgi:hypothetical protein
MDAHTLSMTYPLSNRQVVVSAQVEPRIERPFFPDPLLAMHREFGQK